MNELQGKDRRKNERAEFFFSFTFFRLVCDDGAIGSKKQSFIFSPSLSLPLSLPLLDPQERRARAFSCPLRGFKSNKRKNPRSPTSTLKKKTLAEAFKTRELDEPERDADFFPLNDLPNDVLVSVFAAVKDRQWARHTVPLVCRA